MNHTQQFLDDALAGGWKYEDIYPNVNTAYMLLDTKAWQAVGKTRGWDKRITYYNSFADGKENNEPWRLDWHGFIDDLADGKSIEEALEAIS
jgi:hypothetical protein